MSYVQPETQHRCQLCRAWLDRSHSIPVRPCVSSFRRCRRLRFDHLLHLARSPLEHARPGDQYHPQPGNGPACRKRSGDRQCSRPRADVGDRLLVAGLASRGSGRSAVWISRREVVGNRFAAGDDGPQCHPAYGNGADVPMAREPVCGWAHGPAAPGAFQRHSGRDNDSSNRRGSPCPVAGFTDDYCLLCLAIAGVYPAHSRCSSRPLEKPLKWQPRAGLPAASVDPGMAFCRWDRRGLPFGRRTHPARQGCFEPDGIPDRIRILRSCFTGCRRDGVLGAADIRSCVSPSLNFGGSTERSLGEAALPSSHSTDRRGRTAPCRSDRGLCL